MFNPLEKAVFILLAPLGILVIASLVAIAYFIVPDEV
jgi:hypothetical protein